MAELKEGEIILCTVDQIEGTTVFVSLPSGQKGTIVTSEIAPGRIRNIREYVVPKKKIVCKILRIKGDNIDLSLRRVNSKEKKEIMQKYKQEQTSKSALHSILKDNAQEIEEKILKKFTSLLEFLTEARENEKLIDEYIPKPFHEQIKKLTQKKQKHIEVRKIIRLKCLESDGILRIKKILSIKNPQTKITYLSAGKFQINLKGNDYKQANKELEELLEKIKASAKENKCEFEIEEKSK